MNKKEKLVGSLKIAINALKKDIVHYDWTRQASCNCGVVSQAVLGQTPENIRLGFGDVIKSLKIIDKDMSLTWRNGVQRLCSITGKTDIKILQDLMDAGLRPEDMVHLEYMNNAAILERSGIEYYETKTTTTQVESGRVDKIIPHPLFGFLGVTKKVTEIQYENKVKTNKYLIEDYHTNKNNLIKYLSAWVDILEDGYKHEQTEEPNKEQLESDLLNAVASEDFEYAATVRDKLDKLVLK